MKATTETTAFLNRVNNMKGDMRNYFIDRLNEGRSYLGSLARGESDPEWTREYLNALADQCGVDPTVFDAACKF